MKAKYEWKSSSGYVFGRGEIATDFPIREVLKEAHQGDTITIEILPDKDASSGDPKAKASVASEGE